MSERTSTGRMRPRAALALLPLLALLVACVHPHYGYRGGHGSPPVVYRDEGHRDHRGRQWRHERDHHHQDRNDDGRDRERRDRR